MDQIFASRANLSAYLYGTQLIYIHIIILLISIEIHIIFVGVLKAFIKRKLLSIKSFHVIGFQFYTRESLIFKRTYIMLVHSIPV